jgi:glycerol-3-phosphate cytidylyltransferase
VDEIIPYATERDLEDILTMYHIDVRILGEEYREKEFTGKDICRKRGIELFFNKRDHRFSSSDLRKRVAKGEHND